MSEKVACFVDWDNLLTGARHLFGYDVRIDFRQFLSQVVKDRQLLRAYVYTAEVPPGDIRAAGQRAFFEALRSIPCVELRLGRLVRRSVPGLERLKQELEGKGLIDRLQFDFRPVEIQKGVDVRLALDMTILGSAGAYDTAILVSGDGDLVQATQRVRDAGRWVELYYFEGNVSRELLWASDRRIRLDAASIPLLDGVHPPAAP